MTERPWYLDAVFYQVYLRAFRDSNGDGVGDIPGLISKLDHVTSLGADCIWLMPHHPSPRFDDGYDVADYFAVDPAYGDLDDFRRLVAACHDRGLRLITDLVLNHVSSHHPWFQAARRDRHSPYRNYFVWSDSAAGYPRAKVIFPEAKDSNWTFDAAAGQYYWHRFYAEQPDLNYDHPEVPEKMLEVARFWLELGVDGFRVDAIPYLYEREGTDCENLPETHRFCQRLRQLVDRRFPDALLLCEANMSPDQLLPYLGGDGAPEFHLGFHYPLMVELFRALAEGRAEPVWRVSRQLPELPAGTGLMTYLRNHDELPLGRGGEEQRAALWRAYAGPATRPANGGLPRRLAPLFSGDRQKIEMLHAVLLSLDQPPCFYYGDEIGMGEDPDRDDRHPVRTPMQWHGGRHGGFTDGDSPFTPVIADPAYGFRRVNVEAAEADPTSFLHVFRRLIARRKASAALTRGKLRPVDAPAALLAFERCAEDDTVLAVHNFSADGHRFEPGAGAEPYDGSGDGPEVEPYGWRWWRR